MMKYYSKGVILQSSMSDDKCQYTLKFGARRGAKCGLPVTEGGGFFFFCDACSTREEATRHISSLCGDTGMCKHNLDPYGAGPCERPAVYKGYCFMCLSRY